MIGYTYVGSITKSDWNIEGVGGREKHKRFVFCLSAFIYIICRPCRIASALRRAMEIAARAARTPGAPITPPPGCAPAPQSSRPGTGVYGGMEPGARPSDTTGRHRNSWARDMLPWKIFCNQKRKRLLEWKTATDIARSEWLITLPAPLLSPK